MSSLIRKTRRSLKDLERFLQERDDVSAEYRIMICDTIMRREAAIRLIVDAYEEHFAKPFGISRNPNTGKLTGPGVRFVTTFFKELGIRGVNGKEVSPETIASSWQRMKLGTEEALSLNTGDDAL